MESTRAEIAIAETAAAGTSTAAAATAADAAAASAASATAASSTGAASASGAGASGSGAPAATGGSGGSGGGGGSSNGLWPVDELRDRLLGVSGGSVFGGKLTKVAVINKLKKECGAEALAAHDLQGSPGTAVGPGKKCSPRHPTHCDPSYHELNDML